MSKMTQYMSLAILPEELNKIIILLLHALPGGDKPRRVGTIYPVRDYYVQKGR